MFINFIETQSYPKTSNITSFMDSLLFFKAVIGEDE
jgi:hypothetical protein